MLVADIIEAADFVAPDAPGVEAYDKFSENPELLAIAVVDGGKPVGIINRARFFVKFGDTFGRAVYAKRPAALVMDSNFISVEAETALSDLRKLPINFDNAALLEGFVVVKHGAFAGVSSVLSLYRAVQDQNVQLQALLREVQESKRAAQAADLAKSRFLATITHELRTPLNGILGYAELLIEELGPNHPAAEADIRAITRLAGSLNALINDVIDFAAVEAGKMNMNMDHFDAGEWLQDELNALKILARANRNVLRAEIDPAIGAIVSDPLRLRQCLSNLVGNACKFTQDGEVRVRLSKIQPEAAPARIVLEVSDTGIGMSADQMARLFVPFTQADETITRRFGGTGLGLAITRRIAQALGGDVRVDSVLGQGSVFTLDIPDGSEAFLAAA